MPDDGDHAGRDAANQAAGADVAEALEVVEHVIETAGDVAESAQQLAEGGEDLSETPAPDALRGIGGALGVVDQVAGMASTDPAVRQVLGVAQQAATIAAAAYEAGEAIVEAGEAIIRELSGEADQHRVEYELECAAERDAGWRVREVEIDEKLGAPYCVRLSLITNNLDALPTHLLGQDCSLRISRGPDTSRSIHGLVTRVDHGHRAERHLTTSIEVVPAVDVLRHVQDSRIFQNLTAPEIINAFLGTYLGEYGRELRIETNGTYVQREYCVQYRETALDFLHRLCEEEGLTYFFDQSGEKEVLVVVDDNASFPPSYLLPSAADVPFVGHRGGDIARAEPAYAFAASDRLGPTSLTVADFDWTADRLPFSDEQRSRDVMDRAREQYVHEGATIVGEYDKNRRSYTARDVAARVQRGRERQALSTFEYRGAGAVTGFTVGSVFTLSGHPDHTLDGEYLLVSIRHRGRDSHAGETPRADAGDTALEYENEFICIPSAVPYRAERTTPKPRIHGVQTAIVVGPPDEEIWTDEHGRIRVQLHWDREGRRNQDSTCWVRVMQSWAGAGFGTMFIPRIHMEVVVSFLDGDPDRPLVTGCVYNAANGAPVTVPDDKTQSVLRTQSSPGGNGYNELRFEDKAGEELVSFHAQRDHEETIEHDQRITVHRNQRETVDVDQRMHVGHDRRKTIGNDEEVEVGNNRHVTIGLDDWLEVEGNLTERITGAVDTRVGETRTTIIVGKESRENQGGQHVKTFTGEDGTGDILDVDGSKTDHVTENYDITADRRFKVTHGRATYTMENGMVVVASPSGVRAECGAAYIALEEDGTIRLSSPEKIVLQAGGNMVTIDNTRGSVETVAQQSAAITAAGSQVMADASGVTVAGTTVAVQGSTAATIQGGTVNIN